MTDPATLPVLRIRWQLQFTRCNLKCPYCIAEWTKRPVEFDVEQTDKGPRASNVKALTTT